MGNTISTGKARSMPRGRTLQRSTRWQPTWGPPPLRMSGNILLANAHRSQSSESGEGADFEVCWNLIGEALRDIHNKNCSRLSFEELYRAAYKIVLKKKGDDLYDRVTKFESEWFA